MPSACTLMETDQQADLLRWLDNSTRDSSELGIMVHLLHSRIIIENRRYSQHGLPTFVAVHYPHTSMPCLNATEQSWFYLSSPHLFPLSSNHSNIKQCINILCATRLHSPVSITWWNCSGSVVWLNTWNSVLSCAHVTWWHVYRDFTKTHRTILCQHTGPLFYTQRNKIQNWTQYSSYMSITICKSLQAPSASVLHSHTTHWGHHGCSCPLPN